MSPPLTGHRDDCSGAQRASWHPVLSLLSQSLSHPSLPFCLLLRQALMHAYIIGLGKAREAGTGWVRGGIHRKYSQEFTQWEDRTQVPDTVDIYCLLNLEICFKSVTRSRLACNIAMMLTRSWHIHLFYIKSVTCSLHLLTCASLNWHIFAYVVYLSTGEWVLAPFPERWPGRREAEPFQQRQLRPRLQCLPELLCCDRYNLIHARLILRRTHTAAAGQRHLQQGVRNKSVLRTQTRVINSSSAAMSFCIVSLHLPIWSTYQSTSLHPIIQVLKI